MLELLIFAVAFVLLAAVFALAGVRCFQYLLKHQADQMELFRAKSLEEKFILEAQREEKRILAEQQKMLLEVEKAELKKNGKQPKADDLVFTDDGRPVNPKNLVPDFLSMS